MLVVQRLQLVTMKIAGGKSIGTESGIGTGTNIGAGIRIANQLMDSARSLMLRKSLLFYQMVLPICITTTVVIQRL